MQVWIETDQADYFSPTHLPVDDRGLTYGDGLFETIRILNTTPLFFDRHIARLTRGLAVLNFPIPWDGPALLTRCRKLIGLNEIGDGVLRLTITRGSGPRGFAPSPDVNPTLIIQTFSSRSPIGPSLPATRSALHAILAPWRIDPANPLCQLKHLSALDKVLAKDLARKQNADEAIFQNTFGCLTEATASNLFVVAEGQLLTPALDCGVLPGITRQFILELAPTLGYQVIEGELTLDMLMSASEAFLTNAVSGLLPLTYFDHRPIGPQGGSAPGPITLELTHHYHQHCLLLLAAIQASKAQLPPLSSTLQIQGPHENPHL